MADKDNLMEALENLKTLCLDILITKICNVIDDELFESLSKNQMEKLRDIIKEVINAQNS